MFVGEVLPREQKETVPIGNRHFSQCLRDTFHLHVGVNPLFQPLRIMEGRFVGDEPLCGSKRFRLGDTVSMDEVCSNPEKPRASIVARKIEPSSSLKRNEERLTGDVIGNSLSGPTCNESMESRRMSMEELAKRGWCLQ